MYECTHIIIVNQQYSFIEINCVLGQVKLPKYLEEDDISPDHLDGTKIKDTLLDIYGLLQTMAAGMEQVVWDEERDREEFAQKFSAAEKKLISVLCDLQMVIVGSHIKTRPDVTRDVMVEEQRNLDSTNTKLRDWTIFRDYMNTLNYVHKTLSNLTTK
ncbi:hypothetical protein NQ318_023413 [Aromia moschata]|uniref:Uncharacterized protein n=1 Tax=Aromia moschata TaxID=1265417 RepID=A0AAV8YTR7_9CUCU|nr:hypothetical protein NQ318_023413 [Aromia moschata]